jgi:hypothetical protein
VLHRIRDTHTILADQWRLPVRVTDRVLRAVPTIGNRPRGHGARAVKLASRNDSARAPLPTLQR